MKRNLFTIAGAAAIALALVFSLAGCDNIAGGTTQPGNNTPGTKIPDQPGDNAPAGQTTVPLSLEKLDAALAALPANTAAGPHTVILDSSVVIDTSDTSSKGVWAAINSAVKNAGKYAVLDLSACSAEGNVVEGTSSSSPSGCKMNIIKSNQYVKGIVLPNSLTQIGGYAFSGCTGLATVIIPASVTSIGSTAFNGCNGLEQITVDPANPVYGSFQGILYSKAQNAILLVPRKTSGSITIPEGIISIGTAFNGCTGAISVTIPSSVTIIGNGAFAGCTGLTSVTIPESVTSIGISGFRSSSSDGVTTFTSSAGAFAGCTGLASVTMPAAATANFPRKFTGYKNLSLTLTGTGGIPQGAFYYFNNIDSTSGTVYYCNELASVTIEDGVTGIGRNAFAGCKGLVSLDIGAGVITIGEGCLSRNNISLERITVTPANPVYGSFQGVLYNKEYNSVLWAPEKISGSITIPEGITAVRASAFYGRAGLTSVTIPSSVTSIDKTEGDVLNIGHGAFGNCAGLVSINVAPGNRYYSSVDGVLFESARNIYGQVTNTKEKLVQFPAGRAGSYTIPSGVKTIGESAFEGAAVLTGVTIPCNILPGLDITSSTLFIDDVSTIERWAFSGCTKLTGVTFTGTGLVDHSNYENKLLIEILKIYSGSLTSLIQIAIGAFNGSYGRGFWENAFPQGSSGGYGNALKTAYLSGGAGTYTRPANGSTWTKQ